MVCNLLSSYKSKIRRSYQGLKVMGDENVVGPHIAMYSALFMKVPYVGRERKSRKFDRFRNSAAAETAAQQAHGRPVRSTVGRSSRTVDRPVDRRARRHAQE